MLTKNTPNKNKLTEAFLNQCLVNKIRIKGKFYVKKELRCLVTVFEAMQQLIGNSYETVPRSKITFLYLTNNCTSYILNDILIDILIDITDSLNKSNVLKEEEMFVATGGRFNCHLYDCGTALPFLLY